MRRATKAMFHAAINIFPIGELGNSLPSSNKTIDELYMYVDGSWLFVDGKFKGSKVSFCVPAANCKAIILLPEEPKPAAAIPAKKA